ncbi:MarR family transcriptional regulator [Candidatus Saccharibacteria bacterium]|nr:MarR family transcriptional regulator [Candidatus Saccharibacteria bacterium]
MKKSTKSFESALELLGSKWTLPIVSALLEDKSRFNEIQRKCEVCPRTLSARLDDLEANGIVRKKVYKQNPPRVEYSLTKKGESLSAVINAISDWSYKN